MVTIAGLSKSTPAAGSIQTSRILLEIDRDLKNLQNALTALTARVAALEEANNE